jgi:hypothetical protein
MADEIDGKIADLINAYIENARSSIHEEGTKLVDAAFGAIKQERQDKCLSDEIYSSAEHYLTARCLAAVLTPGVMGVASLAYDGLKFVVGSKNIQKIGLGNKCPASELTFRQTQWKLFGNIHGGRDLIMRSRHINKVEAKYLEVCIAIGIGGD